MQKKKKKKKEEKKNGKKWKEKRNRTNASFREYFILRFTFVYLLNNDLWSRWRGIKASRSLCTSLVLATIAPYCENIDYDSPTMETMPSTSLP